MITVVIPVLDEFENLGRLLPGLFSQAADLPVPIEIIVVDGGSRDGSYGRALALGAKVISTARGRGQQLRAGAEAARGDALLFLHADSIFTPAGMIGLWRRLSEDPDCAGGNFRLLFDGEDRFSRWLNGFYNWIRGKGFYYGDSGIFVRSSVYNRLGGIRAIPVMEDYDFVRRLEATGQTCCISEPCLVTSSRRFQGRSAIKIVSGWLFLHALFHLGVSPDRLASLYGIGWRPPQRDSAG
ncbi:MAG: TIGR04283 family arsenosugar biosynthesis glycosyltransferase [Pseudomonadota bacterium]